MIEMFNGAQVICDNCSRIKLLNIHPGSFTPDVIKMSIESELQRDGWHIDGGNVYCCEVCFEAARSEIRDVLIEKLEKYQEWRLGKDEVSPIPENLTQLIDETINLLKQEAGK